MRDMWVVTWTESDQTVFCFRQGHQRAIQWAHKMADRWRCQVRVVSEQTFVKEHTDA